MYVDAVEVLLGVDVHVSVGALGGDRAGVRVASGSVSLSASGPSEGEILVGRLLSLFRQN